ncbi:hypothetical protein ABZ471_25500 [Streptomyces sp. NPDC005728]|uniref:hypothetical protein n=1 Tax=Streptomyces sp. NPDC005728 TaxID=3157054 RepID=UPI0033D70AD4
MTLLVKSLVTCVFAVALAIGLSLGIVETLTATPEQPNVPLVSFQDGTPAP